MTRRMLLLLVLAVPLVAAGCDRGADDDHAAAARGPYVSGGFGGH